MAHHRMHNEAQASVMLLNAWWYCCGAKGCTAIGKHLHHMQQQVFPGHGCAAIVCAHSHHNRVTIPVLGIRIL